MLVLFFMMRLKDWKHIFEGNLSIRDASGGLCLSVCMYVSGLVKDRVTFLGIWTTVHGTVWGPFHSR